MYTKTKNALLIATAVAAFADARLAQAATSSNTISSARKSQFATPLAAAKKAGIAIFNARGGDLGLGKNLKLRFELLTTEKRSTGLVKEYFVATRKLLGKGGDPAAEFNVTVRQGQSGKWKWNGRVSEPSNAFNND